MVQFYIHTKKFLKKRGRKVKNSDSCQKEYTVMNNNMHNQKFLQDAFAKNGREDKPLYKHTKKNLTHLLRYKVCTEI